MIISFLFTSICAFIPCILIIIIFFLSTRSTNDRENISPFECGFDPQNNARIPFSLRFFLLAVIFLVFDIEIVLLLPLPLNLLNNFIFPSSFLAILFLLILLGGLAHEWNEGSLNWTS